jgi:hypothetical protein
LLKRRNVTEIVNARIDPPIVRGPFRAWRSPTKSAIDTEVLLHYLDCLVGAYELLAKAPYNLPLAEDAVVEVYVVPPEDLAKESPGYDAMGRRIFLPSTTRFPNREDELKWMASAARHELAHAVSHLPLDAKFVHWYWLCEAFAVWVETLFSETHFLTDAGVWIENPETSLRECSYEAFPFVIFFMNRLGDAAFSELWKSGKHLEDSWASIRDFVRKKGLDADAFFADYCLDSYIPNEYCRVMRSVYDRFGHRYAEAWVSLISADVEPLACRYYQITKTDGNQSIHVAGEGEEWNHLHVTVAQVLEGPRRGEHRRSLRGGYVDLGLEFGEAGHLVIVVSSDSARPIRFSLRVEVQ